MRDTKGIAQHEVQHDQHWRLGVLDHRLKLVQQLVMGELVLLTRAGVYSR